MAWAYSFVDLGGAARVDPEVYPAAICSRLPGGDGSQPDRRVPGPKTHPSWIGGRVAGFGLRGLVCAGTLLPDSTPSCSG